MTKPPTGLLAANLVCMASMLVWAAGLPAADVIIPLLPALSFSAARMCLGALALLPVWVLLEGWKHGDLPKIEVWRAALGQAPLYPDDPFVTAVATDDPAALPVPTLLPGEVTDSRGAGMGPAP